MIGGDGGEKDLHKKNKTRHRVDGRESRVNIEKAEEICRVNNTLEKSTNGNSKNEICRILSKHLSANYDKWLRERERES